MFLVVAKKSRTFFSVSHVWLMSRSTRAGSEHSQADSPSWLNFLSTNAQHSLGWFCLMS